MSNMVAERREYDAWVTAVPRDGSEEELWDGFVGNRHWKRCRAHQEPGNCPDRVQYSGGCCGDNCGKGGPSFNDRGDSKGAGDRCVDCCGRVERREGRNTVDIHGDRSGERGDECGDRDACRD